MISKESKMWIEIIETAQKIDIIRARLKDYQLRLIQESGNPQTTFYQ
jgi:hypothetical protein